MGTPTARIGLIKPTDSDGFSTENLAANWQLVDDYAGRFVCTSGTRPPWGAPQEGMTIYEKDTDLEWVWNGSLFNRYAPKGMLGNASRDTDITTTSTTLQVVVQATGVSVPRGGRSVMVQAQWFEVENSAGRSILALYRDTNELHAWAVGGEDTDVAIEGLGDSVVIFDEAPPEGIYTYSLRFAADAAVGGTTTMRATGTRKIKINVVEV